MCNPSAAILCPGPSLADVDATWTAYRHVFAVNGACRSPLPWTHWICADARSVERHIPDEMRNRELLIPWSEILKRGWNWEAFRDRGGVTNGYYLVDVCRPIKWLSSRSVVKYTFLHAIAILVSYGASVIDIYGADLDGDGYYGAESRYATEGGNRWGDQKKLLKRITERAAENGVTIRRVPSLPKVVVQTISK